MKSNIDPAVWFAIGATIGGICHYPTVLAMILVWTIIRNQPLPDMLGSKHPQEIIADVTTMIWTGVLHVLFFRRTKNSSKNSLNNSPTNVTSKLIEAQTSINTSVNRSQSTAPTMFGQQSGQYHGQHHGQQINQPEQQIGQQINQSGQQTGQQTGQQVNQEFVQDVTRTINNMQHVVQPIMQDVVHVQPMPANFPGMQMPIQQSISAGHIPGQIN